LHVGLNNFLYDKQCGVAVTLRSSALLVAYFGDSNQDLGELVPNELRVRVVILLLIKLVIRRDEKSVNIGRSEKFDSLTCLPLLFSLLGAFYLKKVYLVSKLLEIEAAD